MVALSHGHMDHVAAIPYWLSQRHFQKLGPGRIACHKKLEGPLRKMLASWVDLERQQASALQPLADAWDWLLYRFRSWREQGPRTPGAAWALVLLPALAVLAWRVRRRVRRHGGPLGAAGGVSAGAEGLASRPSPAKAGSREALTSARSMEASKRVVLGRPAQMVRACTRPNSTGSMPVGTSVRRPPSRSDSWAM